MCPIWSAHLAIIRDPRCWQYVWAWQASARACFKSATFADAGSMKRRLHTMLLTGLAVIPADPDLDNKVAWQEQAGQQIMAIVRLFWGRPVLCSVPPSRHRKELAQTCLDGNGHAYALQGAG